MCVGHCMTKLKSQAKLGTKQNVVYEPHTKGQTFKALQVPNN
jgi:hypothetical protein